MKKIKLSQFAKEHSVNYRTAYNWFYNGDIPGEKLPTGTILVYQEDEMPASSFSKNSVAIYSRVSSHQQKDDLDRQSKRLTDFAISNGYIIKYNIKEIASGLNDSRPKLNEILDKNDYEILLIEHKDRLTRFGFNYLEKLIKNKNQKILIVNETAEEKDDLMNDFISIITSFCARIYGKRRNKSKTKKLLKELENV